MAAVLNQSFTLAWFAKHPEVFRDQDTTGHQYAALRLLGDYFGGVSLAIDVMSGLGVIRPLQLSNGSWVTVGHPVLITDAVFHVDGGVVVPLEAPLSTLAPDDSRILVFYTDDWVLTDLLTVPEGWLPFIAQANGIDLTMVPEDRWRDWIQDPRALAPGSLASMGGAAEWHLNPLITPTVARTSQWAYTLTVEEDAIETTEAELQAAIDYYAPMGGAVTLVLT